MGTVYAKEKPFEEPSNFRDSSNRSRPIAPQKISLAKASARVDKINIDGIARTKNDVVEACLNDLFKATNFEEVLIKADKVKSKLDALGCFSNVGIFIDVSKGPKATADGYEVTFHVEELKRVTGGVNTTVGNNNSGSLVIGLKVPNIAGRGERIQCEYSRGFHRFSNFSVALSKPFPYKKYEPVVSASLIQQIGEFSQSGYRQLDKGLLLDLGFRTTTKAYHNIQWEGLFRDTTTLNRDTAFAVRESAGPTMKSAIRHIVTIDGRDDRILPTSGSLLQVTSEISGLGGSMSFVKNDINFQYNYTFLDRFTVQATAQTGLLNNFYGTNLTEHFYVGGPLSIRGFENRGVGPRSDNSSLGSNFYWASGLHLFSPLPFISGRGGIGDYFKTHFFVNIGNSLPIRNVSEVNSNLSLLAKDIRLTTGLGMAFKVGNVARFEINYCFPMRYLPTDVPSPGLQIGIGVNFL